MNLILFTLWLGTSIGYLVFLLFKTDVVLEYGKLLKLTKPLRLDEYEAWRAKPDNEPYYYPIFYRENFKPGFWTRLVGCPYCLIGFSSVWASVLCGILALNAKFAVLGLSGGAVATILFLFLKSLSKSE
jgi:hypothetical protein